MKDKVGFETLDVMSHAVGYNKWLLSFVRPFIGREILEAGAGTGNFSNLLKDFGNLTLVDYDQSYIKSLKKKGYKAGFGDLEKGKFFFKKNAKFDTIVNLNVLEHIKDDTKTLRNFYNLLSDGGRLILLTPAHQFAYSSIDKNLGHFRRYNLKNLEKKLIKAGFSVKCSRYLNILGLVGWFVSGKILRKKQLETDQIGIFELISKPFLLLEKIFRFNFGLSVFIVAERHQKKLDYKKVSVIIPVYNEEKTIQEIINRIKTVKLSLSKEIIVVNDGSTDKTKQILSKIKNVKLIHKKNGGKGSAIREGLKYSTGDIILIQDADLEYNPKDYIKLLSPIINKKARVVYGTRLRKLKLKLLGKDKTLHPQNYVANKFLSWFTSTLFNIKITDMETCYKVFRRDLINPQAIYSSRFDVEPELTALLAKRNESIFEVDIKVTPRDYSEGKKIKPEDGIEAIKTLLAEKFTR